MHDSFESLLKRCKAHRRKKIMGVVRTGFLAISALGALGWLFLFSEVLDENEESTVSTFTPVKTVSKKVTVVTPVIVAPKVIEKPVEKVLKPVETMVVQKKPLRKDLEYDIAVDESYLKKYTQAPSRVKKEKKVVPKKIKKVVLQESKLPKKKPLVVSTKKIRTAKEMQVHYEREPHYNLALKISQYYFDNKKYSKASLWAKKANILDKSSDKAWIMYAKSEYARGNKDRAKDILGLYLGNKSSKDAELLLMTWNQGK